MDLIEGLPCDQRILDELVAVIRGRLGRQVRDFGVSLGRRGFILTGRAATYYAKQMAQHIVMETSGCAIAANNIDVRRFEHASMR